MTRPPPADEIALEPFVASIPARISPLPVQPIAPEQQCVVEHASAQTVIETEANGARIWTVTFGPSTTMEIIAKSKRIGPDRELDVSELDCQLDKQLRARCPYWMHDPSDEAPAIDLPDGRLRLRGFCDSESANKHLKGT